MADSSVTAIDNSGEPKPLINEKDTILGILIPFMVVQWICVSLRFWSRIRLRCLGYDDAFVMIAAVLSTLGSIFICLATENGLGEHFSLIGMANIVSFQQKYYISLLAYNIATTFTKLCLLAQYIRIFDKANPLRRVCWGFLIVTTLWGVAFIVISAVPCVPVSAFWHRGTGHCYGYGSIETRALQRTYTAQNVTNVLLDLVVLAIPVPLYFDKATPWKTRMGIGCLLLCGVAVNLVSIWRLQTLVQTKAATYPVIDPTWYGPKSIVLAAIEVNLASICASVPVFWPMITQRLNKIFVTQEVHVVRQHRRLSGEDRRPRGYAAEHDRDDDNDDEEDNYELRVSESGTTSHSRGGSEASLSLVRLKAGVLTKHQQQQPIPTTPHHHQQQQQPHHHTRHNDHYSDKYVASRVTPLGLNKDISASEAEIKSEGKKGFKKEQLRFGNNSRGGGGGGGGCGSAGFQPKSIFED